MFAVPGWAVSADTLKSETASASKPTTQGETESKKRKRASHVTTSNVADLWEQIIEGRSGKKARPDQSQENGSGEHGNDGGKGRSRFTAEGKPKLTLKEKKKLKKLRDAAQNGEAAGDGKSAPNSSNAPPSKEGKKEKKKSKSKKDEATEPANHRTKAPPPQPKLTPMQAAMREKLVSARFRHLNETLYTKPSTEALQLFQDSPELFHEYHEGFRRQVDVWPENPIDGYIRDVQERGAVKQPPKSSSSSSKKPASPGTTPPLPRTGGTCTIADLGCGDAKLAAALQPQSRKLRLRVLSYDLQSPSPLVTRADIADLPLADGSVNVVVFCLALMGTNWLDFVEEAWRALHWKGELWVAEIKSRFGPVGGGGGKAKGQEKGRNAPVDHSVGKRRKVTGKPGKKGKGGDDGEEGDHETELAVEVDGVEDRREETDVSAFVEALRKRGFVLQDVGNNAVDLSNKMFVKMHFAKAATPTVGKGAVAVAPKESSSSGGGFKKNNGIKFIEEQKDTVAVDESSILKPCVYKQR
ncbi:methyltransferase-domain-containing protein [Whalleya microplaca]|nr:methyltransferase-domain-containing protein [Whalleya microplaca]